MGFERSFCSVEEWVPARSTRAPNGKARLIPRGARPDLPHQEQKGGPFMILILVEIVLLLVGTMSVTIVIRRKRR